MSAFTVRKVLKAITMRKVSLDVAEGAAFAEEDEVKLQAAVLKGVCGAQHAAESSPR